MSKISFFKIIFAIVISISSFGFVKCETPQNGLGITFGYFNALNDVLYVNNCVSCWQLNDFNRSSYFVGLTYEIKTNLILDFSILSKLKYISFSFFESQFADTNYVLVMDDVGKEKVIDLLRDIQWEGKYTLLTFDLTPKIKIPYFNFGIYAGVSLGYLIYSDYNEYLTVVTPSDIELGSNRNYKSKNAGRTLILKEGEFPDKNDFRYGIKAGIDYDLEIGDFQISPFIEVDIPLSSVLNKYNTCEYNYPKKYADDNFHWKITYINMGIDLKYLF